MTQEEALSSARKIVKKSRHTTISATGERYEPREKFVGNLHKNIASAILDAEKRERERCAKIVGEAAFRSEFGGDPVRFNDIAEAIRKGE